jgi:hypothetical protein
MGIRYNYELHTLYKDMDIRTYIKVGRLKRLVMSKWTSSDLRKEFSMQARRQKKKWRA